MRSIVFVILLCLVLAEINAQKSDNPNLLGVIEAERAFIKMAKEKNGRDAFLYFLTDSAITSGPNGPVKGKERLKKQPVNNSWLFWEVTYSDIAASGDFGYNTGPWEFRQNKTDEKAVAFGQFSSVWKKQNDGSWKILIDLGMGHPMAPEKENWETALKPSVSQTSKSGQLKTDEFLDIENKFLEAYNADRISAYNSFLSSESRLNHQGNLPIRKPEAQQKFLRENAGPSNVRLMGGEVASSGDLGFVYGSADVTVTKDGKSEIKKASYMRIWKRGSRGWKIVLDVLSN